MKAILYRRVSRPKQGVSGLGLEAQAKAITDFVEQRSATVLASFIEVESGKRNDRPELMKAIALAKLTGATIVIAKLDRLGRNAAFLMTLKDSGVDFVAVDNPHANRLTIGILALVAQEEATAISIRTREALAAIKARGTWVKDDGTPFKQGKRLGNPLGISAMGEAGRMAGIAAKKAKADAHAERLKPTLEALLEARMSLRGMATTLNAQGILTPRSGRWHPTSVKNALARIAVG